MSLSRFLSRSLPVERLLDPEEPGAAGGGGEYLRRNKKSEKTKIRRGPETCAPVEVEVAGARSCTWGAEDLSQGGGGTWRGTPAPPANFDKYNARPSTNQLQVIGSDIISVPVQNAILTTGGGWSCSPPSFVSPSSMGWATPPDSCLRGYFLS